MAGAVATGRRRSAGADAVNSLTYHGAKGLEWPLVVVTDLEKCLNGNLFGLSASTVCEVYWRDPPAGRVLRFWPWPREARRASIQDAEGQPHVRLEVDRVEVGNRALPALGLDLRNEEEMSASRDERPGPAAIGLALPRTRRTAKCPHHPLRLSQRGPSAGASAVVTLIGRGTRPSDWRRLCDTGS